MGTYTYSGHSYPTESKWIKGSNPYVCTHPEHTQGPEYDPDVCLAGHITMEDPLNL